MSDVPDDGRRRGFVLLIGADERSALHGLRCLALRPERLVRMEGLLEQLRTPEGKEVHRERMTEQTVLLPVDHLVTFALELHPGARTCRHVSVSVAGGAPHPDAVAKIAEFLGFAGNVFDTSVAWVETLQGHGQAINVVQPVAVVAEVARG